MSKQQTAAVDNTIVITPSNIQEMMGPFLQDFKKGVLQNKGATTIRNCKGVLIELSKGLILGGYCSQVKNGWGYRAGVDDLDKGGLPTLTTLWAAVLAAVSTKARGCPSVLPGAITGIKGIFTQEVVPHINKWVAKHRVLEGARNVRSDANTELLTNSIIYESSLYKILWGCIRTSRKAWVAKHAREKQGIAKVTADVPPAVAPVDEGLLNQLREDIPRVPATSLREVEIDSSLNIFGSAVLELEEVAGSLTSVGGPEAQLARVRILRIAHSLRLAHQLATYQ